LNVWSALIAPGAAVKFERATWEDLYHQVLANAGSEKLVRYMLGKSVSMRRAFSLS